MCPLVLCNCAWFPGSRQQNSFICTGTVWQTFPLNKRMQSPQRRQWSYARWKPVRTVLQVIFSLCIYGKNPRGSFANGNKHTLTHRTAMLHDCNLQVTADVLKRSQWTPKGNSFVLQCMLSHQNFKATHIPQCTRCHIGSSGLGSLLLTVKCLIHLSRLKCYAILATTKIVCVFSLKRQKNWGMILICTWSVKCLVMTA